MADQNDAAMSLPPQHFFEDNFPPNGLFKTKKIKIIFQIYIIIDYIIDI